MKKWIFTFILALGFISYSQAQTTIIDPEDYIDGGLPDGWSVVTIDGTYYFQVITNGWSAGVWDAPYVTTWDGDAVSCDVKYAVGSAGDSLDVDGYKGSVKLYTDGADGQIILEQSPMSSTFTTVTAAIPDDCDTISNFQIWGQTYNDPWKETTGDTLWFSAVVTNGTSLTNMVTVFDPAPYADSADVLPDGWSVVDIDGESYMQVITNGWNSIIDIPLIDGWEASTIYCTFKYALGSASVDTLTLDSINAVVKITDTVNTVDVSWEPYTAPSEAAMTQEKPSGDFVETVGSIPSIMTYGHQLQVSGQLNISPWSPTVGDTIWFSKITVPGSSTAEEGVLFNPATYPEDQLPEGMEIVIVGSDTLLKITTQGEGDDEGWANTLPLANIYSMGDDNTITFKMMIDPSNVTPSTLDSFNYFVAGAYGETQLFTDGGASTDYATLSEISIYTKPDILIEYMQFATQLNHGTWGAVNDMIIYIGKVTASEVTTPNNAPRVTYTVPYTFGETIELDGLQQEDAWFEADVAPVDQKVSMVDGEDYPSSDADNSAVWYALYDETYLYVYVDITDDKIVPIEGADEEDPDGMQQWMNDGVEMFLDIKDRRYDLARISSEQHQVRFNIGRKYADTSAFNEYKGAWGEIEGSTTYQFEIAMPWGGIAQGAVDPADVADYVADSIKPGKKIAFEISVIDADVQDDRKSILNWSNNTGEDQAYNTSLYYGQLILGANSAIRKTNALTAKIYPNPANETLNISMEGMTQVIIYNVAGQKVMVHNNHNNSATLNVSELNTGLYIVEVRSAKGSAIQKVTIK